MRDILIEMRSDVKHLVENFNKHTQQDKDSFDKIEKDFRWVIRVMWAGGGIISFVLVVVRFIH